MVALLAALCGPGQPTNWQNRSCRDNFALSSVLAREWPQLAERARGRLGGREHLMQRFESVQVLSAMCAGLAASCCN